MGSEDRGADVTEAGTLGGSVDTDDDTALIRWMLSLSPAQRLEVAQGFVDSVEALRGQRG